MAGAFTRFDVYLRSLLTILKGWAVGKKIASVSFFRKNVFARIQIWFRDLIKRWRNQVKSPNPTPAPAGICTRYFSSATRAFSYKITHAPTISSRELSRTSTSKTRPHVSIHHEHTSHTAPSHGIASGPRASRPRPCSCPPRSG